MAFALLFIGLILIIASARGTLSDLGTLLKGDFTGPNNFFYWLLAIGAVGAIGYSQKGAAFSRAFMTLILLAMVLSNKGFFAKLMEALGSVEGNASAGQGTAAGNTVDKSPAPQTGGKPSGTSQANQGATSQTGSNPVGGVLSEVDQALQQANKVASGVNQLIGVASGGAGGFNVSSASGLVGAFSKVMKAVPIIGSFF